MTNPLRREPIRAAERAGWVATLTRKNHVRLRHPTGIVIYASGTPSCQRAAANMLADLARALRRQEARR
jgi:predicted RNA binding protein YcfA (HicA-like mRNA interferase family)